MDRRLNDQIAAHHVHVHVRIAAKAGALGHGHLAVLRDHKIMQQVRFEVDEKPRGASGAIVALTCGEARKPEPK
jgi:hypothetical protein